MSTIVGKSLVFSAPGVPTEVLRLEERTLPGPHDLESGQILVKMLVSPINPSDVNTVEGKYPISVDLPGTPGNEGVGEVLAVGDEVTGLSQGDHVIPVASRQATWQTHTVARAKDWLKVPASLPLEAACALSINPPTALLMLRSFVELKSGDTVIQNGANSAVGRYVIQIAASMGVNTVNIVRPRGDEQETAALTAELKGLGAAVVTTPDALKADLAHAGLAAPKLALDCVGGDVGLATAKALTHGGTMVTYGAMSKKPLPIPAPLLIFKNLKFLGFWLSGAYAAGPAGRERKDATLLEVIDLFERGVLKPAPLEKVDIDEWPSGFTKMADGRLNKKVVLWFGGK